MLRGSSPLRTASLFRGTIGSTTRCPSRPIWLLRNLCSSFGQHGIHGSSVSSSGSSWSWSIPSTFVHTERWVSGIHFRNLLRMLSTFNARRILACLPQGHHRHHLHHPWYRRECGRKPGARVHRGEVLAYTRSTVRGRFWRFRPCIRDCQLRL